MEILLLDRIRWTSYSNVMWRVLQLSSVVYAEGRREAGQPQRLKHPRYNDIGRTWAFCEDIHQKSIEYGVYRHSNKVEKKKRDTHMTTVFKGPTHNQSGCLSRWLRDTKTVWSLLFQLKNTENRPHTLGL